MPYLTPRRPVHFTRNLVVSLGLALASLALAQAAAPTPAALEAKDAREAVQLANAWKGGDVTSFATPEAVQFAFPDGTEVEIPMPEDEMLVSVAPYRSRTHPCTTHYMSSCQGELARVTFDVRATLPDGTVVLDEAVTSGPNGFLDLWLPRREAIVLNVSTQGHQAEGFLTTFADSATCITTMQLTRAGR